MPLELSALQSVEIQIALLIPCHRVIQKSGQIGGYMWGENRKRAIIAWEGLKTDEEVK